MSKEEKQESKFIMFHLIHGAGDKFMEKEASPETIKKFKEKFPALANFHSQYNSYMRNNLMLL